MADRYERIRKALKKELTPGPWELKDGRTDTVENAQGYPVCTVHWHPDERYGHGVRAAYIAACDPDTIRELLAERDALAAENERLKEDRARFPSKPDDIGRIIEAHIGNLKAGKKSTEALADKAFDRAFRAEAALAEKDKEIAALRKALGRILENEAPDWKAAEAFGGYVLDDDLREEARAALSVAERADGRTH